MAKRILIPLEQSVPDEPFLALVDHVARGSGGTVRLLHVAPVPGSVVDVDGRVIAYSDQEMARVETDARDYLQTIELLLEGVPVEAAVRFGDPADEIVAEAESFGADLIVLRTHTRSSLGRAFLGSVAEQVFRRAEAPVVLFRS